MENFHYSIPTEVYFGKGQIKNLGKGKHSFLTGLIKCGYCGYSMNVKKYKEQKYFNCTGRYKTNDCVDKLKTHYVSEVEDFVFNEMRDFSVKFKNLEVNKKNTDKDKINTLKIELHKIETEIENIINNLSTANSTLINYANKKITELDNQKISLLKTIHTLQISSQKLTIPELSDKGNYDIEFKRETAHKIINNVYIFNDKIKIDWIN